MKYLSIISLTELAPLNFFAQRTEGWNSNNLAVTAWNAAINILLPFRSGSDWSNWLIYIVPHVMVDKEVRLR